MKNLIDLHCHLDGSLNAKTTYNLAKNRELIENIELNDFKKMLSVEGADVDNLADYLSLFELPISILQDEESLAISTINVIKNLHKDGVIYAEIRFAPQQHLRKGLTQEQVIKAVLQGVEEASDIYSDVKVQIILCMMRSFPVDLNHDANIETIKLAKQFLGKGVCAIDLAGGEIDNLIEYKQYFDYAKELKVPFVIHAGEVEGCANNVSLAIDFGAKRIGHGIHAIDDEEVLKKLVKSKVPLEVCITSNIHCKNAPSFKKHPLRKLYDAKVNLTLNTDNRTLSDITLNDEIDIARDKLDFTKTEIREMMINSLNASFLNDKQKDKILDKLLKQ